MFRDQITRAIGAHGLWQARLRRAVMRGSLDVQARTAGDDDRCEFGRWLHALPASDRDGPHFERVRALHADFHREAAAVLALAHQGRHDEARARLEPGAELDRLTTELTEAMIAWARAA